MRTHILKSRLYGSKTKNEIKMVSKPKHGNFKSPLEIKGPLIFLKIMHRVLLRAYDPYTFQDILISCPSPFKEIVALLWYSGIAVLIWD